MPLAAPTRPLTNNSGFGPTDRIPITGATNPGLQGGDSTENEAAAKRWLMSQPWYLATMQAWGQDPAHPTLSIQQRIQLTDAAYRAGLSHDLAIDNNADFKGTSFWGSMDTLDKVLFISGLAAVGGGLAAGASSGGAPAAAGGSTAGGTSGGASVGGAGAAAGGTGAAGGYTPAALGFETAGGAGAAGAGGVGAAAADAPVYLTNVGEGTGLMGSIPWGDVIRYGVGQGINAYNTSRYQDALNDASKAQIDAINRAIDLQSRIYDTTRADVNQARGGYKPYQQLGQSVLPTLYKMVGLTPPSGAAGVAPTGLTNAGAQGQGLNGPNSVPGRRFGTEPVGPGTSLTGVGATDHSYQTGGLTGGAQSTGDGMVNVQAPTGETRRVPYQQAVYLQSIGGRIVG